MFQGAPKAASFSLFGASYATGLVMPWLYSRSHNATLSEVLHRGEQNPTVSLLPVLNPTADEYGFIARITL